MIFLRRAAHYASIVTLFLLVACAALAQPRPKAIPQPQNDASVSDKKTQEELQKITAELRAIREQQAAIEATRATKKPDYGPPLYSNWFLFAAAVAAAIAAVLTLRAIEREVAATRKAANAADRSSKTAELSLRLLNRPWLDTEDWSHDGEIKNSFQYLGRELFTLSVTLKVVNLGPTPARIRYISGGYQVEGDSGRVEHSTPEPVSHVINPKGSYPYTVHIGPLNEIQRAAYDSPEGLHVGIRGAIYFDDLFQKVMAPEKPIPFTRAQNFEGRIWHYGRYALLRPSSQASTFSVPFGEEGVGVNDEDWKEEKNEGQPEV